MKQFVLILVSVAFLATVPAFAADSVPALAGASTAADCAGVEASLAGQSASAVETAAAEAKPGDPNLGACGPWIESEPCQTGGWWTGSCGQCSGTCYFRYEGYLHVFWYGTKADSFSLKTRCSTPPGMATCNTTCS